VQEHQGQCNEDTTEAYHTLWFIPYKAFEMACASRLKEEVASFSASAATIVRTFIGIAVVRGEKIKETNLVRQLAVTSTRDADR
jgi:hypothetical protein